jgi:hypothetical protein
VRFALTRGEAHDNHRVIDLLSDLRSGAMLLTDRGYDDDWILLRVYEFTPGCREVG